jgi:hypothetical protein
MVTFMIGYTKFFGSLLWLTFVVVDAVVAGAALRN